MIAGELAGHVPPSPPPHSWAVAPEADVALWHVVLEPGASWTMPAATADDTVRVLYVFDGSGVDTGPCAERIVPAIAKGQVGAGAGVDEVVAVGRVVAADHRHRRGIRVSADGVVALVAEMIGLPFADATK